MRDILKELEKPGRDPRPEFVTPSFAEGVEDIKDLDVGMVLEGRISNVAAFGAFVDIGVHQDGLVQRFGALAPVRQGSRAMWSRAGDIVKVKVMEVDLARKRIALSMRLDDVPGESRGGRPAREEKATEQSAARRRPQASGGTGQQHPDRCLCARQEALIQHHPGARRRLRRAPFQPAVRCSMRMRMDCFTIAHRDCPQGEKVMPRLRVLSGAIVAALVFSSGAHATIYKNVIVFGDSLSDNGNLSLASGAQTPSRFTTNPGEVAIEHVADGYGITLSPSRLGGSDYAWGGAGVNTNSPGTPAAVPTISAQVSGYLAAAGSADPDALYSVWGGANDIFYHATAAGASAKANAMIADIPAGLPPAVADYIAALIRGVSASVAGVSSLETADQAQTNVAAAAVTEVGLIDNLQSAGAKHILVFNLPDIGATPSAAAQGADAATLLTDLSLIYNIQLNTGLSQAGDGIVPVDVYSLFKEVIANPSAYGFSNVTDAACGAGSISVQCGPEGSGAPYTYADGTQNSYLFADGVHPTTAAHALLGQYVAAELAAPEQVSLLAEAPLAVGSFQATTLTQQMTADVMGAGTRTFARVGYGRQSFDANNGAPGADSDNANLSLGRGRAGRRQRQHGCGAGPGPCQGRY